MDAIVLRNVTKRFARRPAGRDYSSFKTELVRWVRGERRARSRDWFEVLRGVDLAVPRGTTMGIIGRNGSGKSTLLKLMTGIYRPTSGSVEVNGRVSALLELGAGFHPEFTGRENILINGVILGMSRREVRARIPQIVEFSELGDYIDQPVRTYSSGMYMRLAFAVATHVDPDLLIVDEILAVGDDHFARKSLAKMLEFKRQKKTIVLVTHDLASVERWCDMAAWIDGGRIREVGAPRDVVDRYRRDVFAAEMTGSSPPVIAPPGGDPPPGLEAAATPGRPADGASQPASPSSLVPKPEFGPAATPDRRFGSFALELASVQLLSEGAEASQLDPEGPLTIAIEYVAKRDISDVVFGIGIHGPDGRRVYGTNTEVDRVPLPSPLPPRGSLRFEISRLGLVDGEYSLEVAAHTAAGEPYDWQRGLQRFAVRSTVRDVGVVRPPHRWVFTAGSAALPAAARR